MNLVKKLAKINHDKRRCVYSVGVAFVGVTFKGVWLNWRI
jgi:hypothetical protein